MPNKTKRDMHKAEWNHINQIIEEGLQNNNSNPSGITSSPGKRITLEQLLYVSMVTSSQTTKARQKYW